MFKKLLLAVLALTAVTQTVSAQGLRKDGDNYYLEALANGKVQIGTYGTGDFEIVLNAGSTAPVVFSFDAAGSGLTIPSLSVSAVSAITGTGANTSILRSNQTGTLGLYSGTSADYSTGANIALDGDDLGGADAGGSVLINTSDNTNSAVNVDVNGSSGVFRVRDSADASQFSVTRAGLINGKSGVWTGYHTFDGGMRTTAGTTLPAGNGPGHMFYDTDSDDCADTGGGDGQLCVYNGSSWEVP